MTPYIQQQLKKLCDNPNWYDDMLISWDKTQEINRKGLSHFMNDDQGYESGISMYGHYIACKCLDISSEREYMNQYTDIRILTNEL